MTTPTERRAAVREAVAAHDDAIRRRRGSAGSVADAPDAAEARRLLAFLAHEIDQERKAEAAVDALFAPPAPDAPDRPGREYEATAAREARLNGYEGTPCPSCGERRLVRSGAVTVCERCGPHPEPVTHHPIPDKRAKMTPAETTIESEPRLKAALAGPALVTLLPDDCFRIDGGPAWGWSFLEGKLRALHQGGRAVTVRPHAQAQAERVAAMARTHGWGNACVLPVEPTPPTHCPAPPLVLPCHRAGDTFAFRDPGDVAIAASAGVPDHFHVSRRDEFAARILTATRRTLIVHEDRPAETKPKKTRKKAARQDDPAPDGRAAVRPAGVRRDADGAGGRAVSRATICAEIAAERERQDLLFGGPEHDDRHSLAQWIVILVQHLGLAGWDGSPEDVCHLTEATRKYDPRRYRLQLVRLAAVAVAALEAFDRGRAAPAADPATAGPGELWASVKVAPHGTTLAGFISREGEALGLRKPREES